MATQSLVHPARQSSRKAFTPEEILKVLRVASESKRNLALILLAYRHGMRASEVCEPGNQGKGAAFGELLQWMLSSGQKECCAPLPREVANRELQLLSGLK